MIIKCIPGGIFMTNCYILGDEETNEGILIDPGEQMDEIMSEVKKSGLKITKIVNTHTHIDHVAGVQQAKEELGVPFYLHPEDEPVLQVLPEAAARFPQFGNVRVPEIDVYIEEGDEIEVNIADRALILHVSDEELARRRKNWTPMPPKIQTGYLSRYARMVTSASEGAILK